MKSTSFVLDPTAVTTVVGTKYTFRLPLLAAYAVEYFTINYGALSTFPSDQDLLAGDTLSIDAGYTLDDLECRIVIYYHGIRDYRLLFPSIAPSTLQERLGNFYREAEAAFETQAWLSFMLACGALFEGLLFFRLTQDKPFFELINLAEAKGLIDSNAAKTLHVVRQYRNLVHAKSHATPYVERADAMDTRVLLDKLLRTI